MRVLYIGGTGEISYHCIYESLCLGHEVCVFNRGGPRNKSLPECVTFYQGDIQDDDVYRKLADEHFDVICQFRLYTASQMRRDLEIFTGHCGQYVFISSASAYQKPVRDIPITERTPLDNPFWPYSQDKIAAETVLCEQRALPHTIVRPSHTYRTHIPTPLNSRLDVSRLLRGRPVIVPGDGETFWTPTHGCDFAPPFVRLLGNTKSYYEDFHITRDEAWSWNRIMEAVASALGVTSYQFVHVPTDTLVRYNNAWRAPMMGDKCYSQVYDNSKVKAAVGNFDCPTDPRTGAGLVAEQFPLNPTDYDREQDALHDRIVAEQLALGQ